jgi:hypothetical protein
VRGQADHRQPQGQSQDSEDAAHNLESIGTGSLAMSTDSETFVPTG